MERRLNQPTLQLSSVALRRKHTTPATVG